ncbi:MAG: hypothetical protein OXP73_10005 [Chloroflexota bacterium]|nr:hypothetical protein [Chloroflexota bacterium]
MNARRWGRVRRLAFERDGYRCTLCHRPGRLEAHHDPPLRAGVDPYDVAGVRTLCRACHIDHHQADNVTPAQAEWTKYLRCITLRPA